MVNAANTVDLIKSTNKRIYKQLSVSTYSLNFGCGLSHPMVWLNFNVDLCMGRFARLLRPLLGAGLALADEPIFNKLSSLGFMVRA